MRHEETWIEAGIRRKLRRSRFQVAAAFVRGRLALEKQGILCAAVAYRGYVTVLKQG